MEEQENDSVKNLLDGEAIEKIRELAKDAQVCMFATMLDITPINCRPMSPVDIDEDGNLWFFSPVYSNKNKEIAASAAVQLFFSNMSSSEFLTIYGNGQIVTDRAIMAEKWVPIVKVWFKGGKDDPDLSLIKVTTAHAYYWDTKHNKMVSTLKMLTSIVTGAKMDDGVEGELKI